MKLSAIILSITTSPEFFKMCSDCVNSLISSESDFEIEVIIVESNKDYLKSNFKYPDFVNVIIPSSNFNFHKFLNIGIKASTGDYIALCNNDLIFSKYWFSEMMKVKKSHPSIKSFSPTGLVDDITFTKEFEIGYKVRTHVMGWCIVANREVFSKISFLDETFDFYYADNDYAMTLKLHNIKHAVVFNSKVIHLEKKSTPIQNENFNKNKLFLNKYKIPNYLWNDEYKWVLENEKNVSGFLKFHNKWGNPNFLYRKNRIADILINNNLGSLVKYFFKMN